MPSLPSTGRGKLGVQEHLLSAKDANRGGDSLYRILATLMTFQP
jgi:hypothetical protein